MPATTATEPPSASCTSLALTLRHFSQRLIAAQRCVRPLEAVQWDPRVEHDFLARGCRELPRVTRADYFARPLPFDPEIKQMEFEDLERDIVRGLGSREGVGRVLVRMCREYAGLVRLLAHRGTRTFAAISARLFGTTRSGADQAMLRTLDEMSALFPARATTGPERDAEQAMGELAARLSRCFPAEAVRVKLVERIASDAAAGTDYLKLRRDARYSADDIRLLEVHEGWVHLGTSFNARAQSACAFLCKGPPSSTRTQEGLAVLTEFLSGAAHPGRLMRLRRRVQCIRMAEEGADFLEVFHFLRESVPHDRDCYHQTARVFRGSLPSGCGPFTKDLSYLGGLAAVIHFLRHNAGTSRERIRLLFAGKAAIEDIATLEDLAADGLLVGPSFIPPPFRRPFGV